MSTVGDEARHFLEKDLPLAHAAEEDAGVDAAQHTLPARSMVGEQAQQRDERVSSRTLMWSRERKRLGEELSPGRGRDECRCRAVIGLELWRRILGAPLKADHVLRRF